MTSPQSRKLIVIAGPTASGKSSLAMALARKIGGEIVNCDSVQLYRGFDIGSAKPTPEEKKLVPHHLFDVADWREDFDARRFAQAARDALDDIIKRRAVPVLVGGTGLYLRALWEDEWHRDLPKDDKLRLELQKLTNEELAKELQAVDPRRATQIHLNDRYRLLRAVELVRLLGRSVSDLPSPETSLIKQQTLTIVLKPERRWLHQRIAQRTTQMLAAGLLDEVRGLLRQGCPPDAKPMQSIGYKQAIQYLDGELDKQGLEQAIVVATRQYAKRQDTWFGKLNADLRLTPPTKEEEMLEQILALWNSPKI